MRALICPPTIPPSRPTKQRLVAVQERLLERRNSLVDVDAIIGLELRIALNALRSGTIDSKLQALLYRPAIEPILLMHGPRIHHANYNQIDALSSACALVGRNLAYRSARCFGKSEVGDVEFEPPDRVALWFPALKAALQNPQYDLAAPAIAFALTVIVHPMTDGNGRLARFLAHALLLKNHNAPLAPIALTPIFYENRLALAESLLRVCNTGEWQDYYCLFADIVMASSDQVEPIIFSSR